MNKSLDMEKAIKKMQKEMKRFNTSSMKLDKNSNFEDDEREGKTR